MFIYSKPTRLVGAITLAMGCSTLVWANEKTEQDDHSLDPIVVTATRSLESINNVPQRISVINSQTLTQSPIASLPELLMHDASMNVVQSGGYGQPASIFLRGTNSSQTLVLRDGVRLNSPTSGLAPLPYIDTTQIKQIEVLKGPASVLYGTDAIGGVVQLVSQTPQKNSAFITAEGGEKNTYKAIVGADLVQNGFYAQVRGQNLATDGTLVTDSKNASAAGFHQKGFSTKVGVEKENYDISLDYEQNQGYSEYDNYGLPASLDFKNSIVNLKSSMKVNDNLDIHTRLSQFKDDQDQNQKNYKSTYDYVHATTQEAELYTIWDFAEYQKLLTGITHRTTDADVISYASPYSTNLESTGYYIQHQYNRSGIDTQVGVRLEDNQQFGKRTVGQGAIRYQLLPLTSVYANIGSAFKAPTVNDLYGYGGNINLDPETSISYEIGLDQKLNYGISTGLSIYKTDVKNLIATSSITKRLDNIDKANIEGAELYAKWQGDALYLTAEYSYVRAKNADTKEDLLRRPRQNLSLTAGWQNELYGLSTSLIARSNAKDIADWPSTTLNNDPGYVSVNLHGFYNVNRNLKLFANVENVADTKYKTAYQGSNVYYINGGRLASAGFTLMY